MKPVNLPSGAQRNADVGLVWREVLSGAQGTFEVTAQTTFRVRAAGATTVTIDGILAMTMSSAEIAIFNAGYGAEGDAKSKIEITIGGANAFVQVAEEKDPGRRTR